MSADIGGHTYSVPVLSWRDYCLSLPETRPISQSFHYDLLLLLFWVENPRFSVEVFVLHLLRTEVAPSRNTLSGLLKETGRPNLEVNVLFVS